MAKDLDPRLTSVVGTRASAFLLLDFGNYPLDGGTAFCYT